MTGWQWQYGNERFPELFESEVSIVDEAQANHLQPREPVDIPMTMLAKESAPDASESRRMITTGLDKREGAMTAKIVAVLKENVGVLVSAVRQKD